MKHLEFLRRFPDMPPRPLYLFLGPETWPLRRFLELLTQRLGAAGIKRFYGDEHGPGDVLAGFPGGLFGDFSVPVILAAEKMKNWAALLSGPFSEKRPLVMAFETELKRGEKPEAYLIKKSKKPEAFFKSQAYVVEMPLLDDENFSKWVARELKREGVGRVSMNVLKSLCEALPRQLVHAKQEIAKIGAYLGGQDLRTWEEIKDLISFQPEALEYRMTDSALAGDAASALRELDRAEASGTRAPDAVSSFSRGLAMMAWASLGFTRMVRPRWKAKTFANMAKDLTPRDTLSLLRKSVRLEIAVRRGGQPRLAAYRALMEMMR